MMKLFTTRGLVIAGSLLAFCVPASAQDFPGSGFLCSTLSIGCPPPPPPPPPPPVPAAVEEPAPVKKVRKHKKKKVVKAEKKEAAPADAK